MNMSISGTIVFSISDLNLDFFELENNINIKPTKMIHRGQLLGKLENTTAPYDIWSFEIKITTEDDISNQLSFLLDSLLPYLEYIKKAINKWEKVVINCYFRSELGQLGFQVSSECINKIAKLGLSLDFHILSFGMVES